jgi:chemotaxis signal transduction protein
MMNEQDFLTMNRMPADQQILGLTIVRCGETLYGIAVKWVREIRPFTTPTPLYGLSPFWVGIMALRGQLYAILDPTDLLCSRPAAPQPWRQILFTCANDQPVGLLVDEIVAVRQVDVQTITAVSFPHSPHASGILPGEIIILDLPRLLSDPRLAALASRTNLTET